MEAAGRRTLELISPQERVRFEKALAESGSGELVDLLDGATASTGRSQDLMLSRFVPAIYERWWRPALGRVVKGLRGPGMADELRIARLLLGLSAAHKVLDVACGPGNFTRGFARTVGSDGLAVGVDVSESMLDRGLRENESAGLDNVFLLRADATALPFADGSFDGVCCFGALHLFAEPFAALAEIERVLAPGGRIAVMTSVRPEIAIPVVRPLFERGSGLRVFERDEIVSHLQMRGFTDIHQQINGLIQFVGARRPT